MNYTPRSSASASGTGLQTIIRLLCTAIFATSVLAQAQTYTVLHSFTGGTGGADGATCSVAPSPAAAKAVAGSGDFDRIPSTTITPSTL